MLLTSNTQLANLALSKLGDQRIADMADTSKPAKEVNAIFDHVRDAELRRYNWRFALARAALSASATAPPWGYRYAYPVPGDMLRLVQVGEAYVRAGRPTPEWQLEGREVLTNLPAPLRVRYVRRVEDPAQFDALFVEALACRLAYELAESLTQSASKKEAAERAYLRAIDDAARCDSLEVLPIAYGGTTYAEDAYSDAPGGTWEGDPPFYGSGFVV